MRGTLQELLGGDVVNDVSDLLEAAQQFRAKHDREDRAVREGALSDGGEGSRTKLEELETDVAVLKDGHEELQEIVCEESGGPDGE